MFNYKASLSRGKITKSKDSMVEIVDFPLAPTFCSPFFPNPSQWTNGLNRFVLLIWVLICFQLIMMFVYSVLVCVCVCVSLTICLSVCGCVTVMFCLFRLSLFNHFTHLWMMLTDTSLVEETLRFICLHCLCSLDLC